MAAVVAPRGRRGAVGRLRVVSEILWTPSEERAASSLLARYMAWLPNRPAGYRELWEWSVEDREGFWKSAWEYCGVIADDLPIRAIGDEAMPGTEWFPGVRLNFAENLLRRGGDGVAVITAAEGRPTEHITWNQLRRKVATAQAGLRRPGPLPCCVRWRWRPPGRCRASAPQ